MSRALCFIICHFCISLLSVGGKPLVCRRRVCVDLILNSSPLLSQQIMTCASGHQVVNLRIVSVSFFSVVSPSPHLLLTSQHFTSFIVFVVNTETGYRLPRGAQCSHFRCRHRCIVTSRSQVYEAIKLPAGDVQWGFMIETNESTGL